MGIVPNGLSLGVEIVLNYPVGINRISDNWSFSVRRSKLKRIKAQKLLLKHDWARNFLDIEESPEGILLLRVPILSGPGSTEIKS